MKIFIPILFLSAMVSCNNSENKNTISNDLIKNPATASNPTASPDKMPIMTFEKTFHDFGELMEGQIVETHYKFTNTGNGTLLIANCSASCGCTVPNWPKDPIEPGESGKITVKFDSNSRSGINEKEVTIQCNTKENQLKLKFTANVKPKTN